ncbi:hypothetical protein [Streptomyces chiangmaiensis]|uniref:Uncharacterized protein n=1 Tax=Streptomyces chiangmaiensis TaxID=766497 RepID=A0ABU7FM47_9ACTN|nr:hypothetical protein [Streptomyces chiangmaiensis]MED7824184.1 hypothetical protein [Streptomyces chiangmaiensis]
MIKDPNVPWPDGSFPYDVLAPAGVNPHTSHADMKDASFELMQAGLMSPEGQNAHRQLRSLDTRLLADLLFFPVDLREALREALRQTERELAEPGEPAQVARSLAVTEELVGPLEDELDGVPLPPPENPQVEWDFAGPEALGLPGLAEQLARFDDGTTPYPTAPEPKKGPR